MKSKPTKRPWKVAESIDGETMIAGERHGDDCAIVIGGGLYDEANEPEFGEIKANAELIVRAVNSHDALVGVAEYGLTILSDWKPDQLKAYGLDVFVEKLEAALKQAEESK